jgi:hypothetical protein
MSYEMKNRIEERVYSVTMTDDELRLFSEFLEQKEYARGNVAGMNPNMVRNGKMIAGKAASSKQARNSSYRRSLQARGETPVKYESRNCRTVEVPGSRAEFNDKVAEAKKHDRLSSRTSGVNYGMPGRYVSGQLDDIQVNGGKFTSLWTSGSVNRIFEVYYGGTINVTGGLFNTNGGIATFVTENTDEATKAAYPYVAK